MGVGCRQVAATTATAAFTIVARTIADTARATNTATTIITRTKVTTIVFIISPKNNTTNIHWGKREFYGVIHRTIVRNLLPVDRDVVCSNERDRGRRGGHVGVCVRVIW